MYSIFNLFFPASLVLNHQMLHFTSFLYYNIDVKSTLISINTMLNFRIDLFSEKTSLSLLRSCGLARDEVSTVTSDSAAILNGCTL